MSLDYHNRARRALEHPESYIGVFSADIVCDSCHYRVGITKNNIIATECHGDEVAIRLRVNCPRNCGRDDRTIIERTVIGTIAKANNSQCLIDVYDADRPDKSILVTYTGALA